MRKGTETSTARNLKGKRRKSALRKTGQKLSPALHGSTPCSLTEAIDVRERVSAEVALRESEARFRSTFEQAFLGIAHIGFDGRWLRVNQRLCDMLGYSREELLARNFQDLIYPEDVAAGVAAFRRLAQGEQREYAREKRCLAKNGNVVSVSLFAALVRDDRGAPLHISAFLQDITQRKLADEQLQLVKSSIDCSPLAAFWFDAEGRVIYVNDSGCRLVGHNRDELLGMRAHELNPGATPTRWAEEFRTIKTKGPNTITSTLFRKDGTTLPVEITSNYFQWAGHEYCLGFATDLTERVRAQRERDAMQGRLNQAERLESVGRLAGGVAHDFNNLLTVIQMSAQQAIAKAGQALPIDQDLQDILAAAARSAKLTRQLLAFARKQTITPTALDLNESIGNILNVLRPLLGENLELAWYPGGGLWTVLMDPSQVDQILTNLCVNARDAIADVGKVIIETGNQSIDEDFCTGNPGAAPGDYVRVRVTDNGCGMNAETQAHIFEPFFTTKGEGKATGLGLATVYGIVTQNHGFLNVSSTAQQGTTFTLYLPRHLGKAESARVERAIQARRGCETILVVEDEPVILRLLTTVLQRLGYAVLATSTPGDAMRTAREHAGKIHLLLTDVVMPEMNGRDLATNVLSLFPAMKCLFMSGYSADIIAHQGTLAAGISFIQKPFAIGDLANKIRAVLDDDGAC